MVDVLKAEGGIGAAPDVQGVIGFENIFTAVVEAAVAQKKADATEGQVLLMVARDAIGDEGEAGAIEFAVPALAAGAQADERGLVVLGVSEGFVAAFIPAPAGEDAEPVIQGLLEIDAETVFDGGLQRMRDDFGNGSEAGLKIFDGLAIAAHVGVIDVGEEADNAFAAGKNGAVELDFGVFGVGASEVGVEVNTVGDFGH